MFSFSTREMSEGELLQIEKARKLDITFGVRGVEIASEYGYEDLELLSN